MIAWLRAHPWTTAGIIYLIIAWAALFYCVSTASKTHEEPL